MHEHVLIWTQGTQAERRGGGGGGEGGGAPWNSSSPSEYSLIHVKAGCHPVAIAQVVEH